MAPRSEYQRQQNAKNRVERAAKKRAARATARELREKEARRLAKKRASVKKHAKPKRRKPKELTLVAEHAPVVKLGALAAQLRHLIDLKQRDLERGVATRARLSHLTDEQKEARKRELNAARCREYRRRKAAGVALPLRNAAPVDEQHGRA